MFTASSTIEQAIKNTLWVEKYKPRKLEDIILPTEIKIKVAEWIREPQKLPHLIILGPPGCGKTSLARIIVSKTTTPKYDTIIINGSSERGLQAIRDLQEFLKFEPYSSKIKIVFIDEADNLTNDAFKALRALIEQYQRYSRFIFTGNYDYFPEFLKSRCYTIKLAEVPYELMVEKITTILDEEKIEYEKEDITKLIEFFFPDLRKILNTLQSIVVNDKIDFSILDKNIDDKDKLVFLMTNIIQKEKLSGEDVNNLLRQTMLTVKKDKRRDTAIYVIDRVINQIEKKMESENFEVRKYYNIYLLALKYSQELRNSSATIAALMEFVWNFISLWRTIYE